MTIRIKLMDQESGETLILADAELNEGVLKADDGYYFDVDSINEDVLQTRDERVVNQVGECQFLDAVDEESGDVIRTEVGWLVVKAEPGLEELNGMYGFPVASEGGVIIEEDGHTVEPLEEGDTITFNEYQ